MRVAIMQPYFFPYLGYFELMSKVDKFVLYSDVQFHKRSWICRNRLPDGYFTIPCKKQRKSILETNMISGFQDYHLRRLLHLYGQDSISHSILSCYTLKTNSLYEFLRASLIDLRNFLKLDCQILESHKLREKTNVPYEEDIINICKLLKCKYYWNLSGGKELYKKECFEENNLTLNFLEPPNYSNMFSILDLCLNEKNHHILFEAWS